MSVPTHSRNTSTSSLDRAMRVNQASGSTTPSPFPKSSVLEISLDKPNPLTVRSSKIPLDPLFVLSALSSSLIDRGKLVSRSEAASPLPKDGNRDLLRLKTHFEDDVDGEKGRKSEGESLSSNEADDPISRKMKDLSGASRTQKRQITTVLMKAPPRPATPRASPRTAYAIEEELSQCDDPKEQPPLFQAASSVVVTSQTHSATNTKPPTPELTDPLKPGVRERLLKEGETIKLEAGLRDAGQEQTFDRAKVKLLTDELGKLKLELQRTKQESDRALTEERGKVAKLTDSVASYEKQLSVQTGDLAKYKQEAETNRKEANVLRQRQDSLYKEIQALNDQVKQLQEELGAREAAFQGELRARKDFERTENQGVEEVRREMEKMRENQTRLEQDVLHWKRRAGLAEGDENSASVRLESYYKELSSLKLEVSIYESKLKEQAASYRALQKEYCTLLDEQTQTRNRSISPLPTRKDPVAASLTQPKDRDRSQTSLAEKFKDANSQIVTSLQQKLTKLESDKSTLQSALAAWESTDTVQTRSRKHTLEMELSMVESNIALLSDKIARYRKTEA